MFGSAAVPALRFVRFAVSLFPFAESEGRLAVSLFPFVGKLPLHLRKELLPRNRNTGLWERHREPGFLHGC